MRKIAIIGSGQAGLLSAHALLAAGYEITLFSDRSAQDWLDKSRPTGSAVRFRHAQLFEQELGLDQWHDVAPPVEGVYLHFCPDAGNQLLTMNGRLQHAAMAIDLRLQSHRWMLELESRGGSVEIEKITTARLEEIAAAHDLVIVAAGGGPLAGLFSRNVARSVYDRPQRKLCMLAIYNVPMTMDGCPFSPVKFNLIGTMGESFWAPYYHKDVGVSWAGVFEAKPGSGLDRFDGLESAQEALDVSKQIYKELFPWNYSWIRDAEVSDELSWLTGAVVPTVREPVARLSSGHLVCAVGDTAMTLDPIGGQGANNGNRMVRHLTSAIVSRGEQPYDEDWLRETFEGFYARHGGVTNQFNNLLLEPLTAAGKLLLISQYGSDGALPTRTASQRLADAIADNFSDPTRMTPAFVDTAEARRAIERIAGRSWWRSFLAGAAAVARNQLRQKLGRAPVHPGEPSQNVRA